MPKIPKTEWYTAAGRGHVETIQGSERVLISKPWYGYRRSLNGKSEEEINAIVQSLKKAGIEKMEIKKSLINHTDIPAGTPFLQISDGKSVAVLERTLFQMGIEIPANRFDIYKQNSFSKRGR